jgi:hypothetical protein
MEQAMWSDSPELSEFVQMTDQDRFTRNRQLSRDKSAGQVHQIELILTS